MKIQLVGRIHPNYFKGAREGKFPRYIIHRTDVYKTLKSCSEDEREGLDLTRPLSNLTEALKRAECSSFEEMFFGGRYYESIDALIGEEDGEESHSTIQDLGKRIIELEIRKFQEVDREQIYLIDNDSAYVATPLTLTEQDKLKEYVWNMSRELRQK